MSFKGLVNVLLMVVSVAFSAGAQPANDACNNAETLCPGVTLSGSNFDATSTVCPDCEDDFTFCFSGDNSVWYTFTTNSTGGDVNIAFSNLNFNAAAGLGNQLQACVVQAVVPCDAATFTLVSNCEAGAFGNFGLTATALLPNTTYYLIVNGARNGGATSPAEATFDILVSGPGIDRPAPTISIGGPNYICPSTPAGYTVYLGDCTDTSAISWYINGQLAALTQGPYFLSSVIANGDVISASCSCFNDCPVALTYNFGAITLDPLYADAGADQSIEAGESVQLNATTNGNTFLWSPSTGVSNDTLQSVIASPTETTLYSVTVSNGVCTLTDNVLVTVSDFLNIPGSFSPNGDGTNDTWIIEGIGSYPNTRMVIYDRWGQQVADISGYSLSKSWDGTNKGRPVTDGVYFYVLDFNDKSRETMKGSITIIR